MSQPIWKELTKAALLGTERNSPKSLAGSGQLGAALEQLNEPSPEKMLLHRAALVMQFERVGQRPASVVAAEALAPCEPDSTPRCRPAAAQRLAQMLSGSQRDVLPEWLRAIAKHKQRVPEEWLPALLDAGGQSKALREHIVPVIGKRGQWLAAQNSTWHFAAGSGVDIVGIDAAALQQRWQTETKAMRLALLSEVRVRDAGLARELIQLTWSADDASSREAFLEALASGLSIDDEKFLEAALDDRSKPVRKQAALSLARLPQSQLSERMRTRALPLLSLQKRTLRKATLIVNPLTDCDTAMQRDGIDAKPPTGMGERAYWLSTLAAMTPLDTWTQHVGLSAVELIELARTTDWSQSLLEGWQQATLNQRHVGWAKAWLELGAVQAGLFAVLPAPEQQKIVIAMAQKPGPVWLALLDASTFDWDETLGRKVLRHVHGLVQNDKPDWELLRVLQRFALRLPAVLASEAARLWANTAQANSPYWTNAANELITTLQFRQDMLKEIS